MRKEELERFQQLNGFLVSMGAYCSAYGFSILSSYNYEYDGELTIYVNLELARPASCGRHVIRYRPDFRLPLKYEKHLLKEMIANHLKKILEQQLNYIYGIKED